MRFLMLFLHFDIDYQYNIVAVVVLTVYELQTVTNLKTSQNEPAPVSTAAA